MNLDISILEQISSVGARNAKIELLKKLENGKELLAIALDPNITFGVTADEDQLLIKYRSPTVIAEFIDFNEIFWNNVFELLKKLSNRELSGNAAKEAVEKMCRRASTAAHAKWFARLINKDLRCGVQLSSLLKVWPKLVEPFQVQLAIPYEPSKHSLQGMWYLEKKLDGNRMVVIDGKAYSRGGKEITSCNHILKELESLGLTKDFVFDGEVMAGGHFDTASGKVRRKDEDAVDAIYHIFDVIRADEWTARETRILSMRKTDLNSCLDAACNHGTKSLHFVLPLVVHNPSNADLIGVRDSYISLGFEGVMIKDPSAPYQFKRSKHLMKFKDYASEDCTVIQLIEGKGKYKGMLGAALVKMPSGVTCEVGTGFTDEERKRFYQTTDLIGHVIEVQHQEPLTEDGRMRFPSFMRMRPDKE